ncbi:hypothetical protein AB0L83_05700 [Streptomyces sp. NPDC052071]|uniref:hypothetical protein n=1 Tax=Streptomyces TaxID=1883 RepID=UPI0033EC4C21
MLPTHHRPSAGSRARPAANGSGRLIDALFAWGTADRISGQIADRLAVGADHVAVQVVTKSTYGFPRAE